ncbi:MmcQ/YjbR family DNA-binding protein [Micrococcales bacterium 31B]|nr:MmcQ/YjbR family DNA-binding protein [Micrococcales bacterium 31B]
MSTEDDVRSLAGSLPKVTERTSYGTPAFYVAGKIFLRFHEEPGVLVCWRKDLSERELLLATGEGKFLSTSHYAGHASVLVRLSLVGLDELAELVTEAWEARAPKRPTTALE